MSTQLPTWNEPDYELLAYRDLIDFAGFDPCPRMSEFFEELGLEELQLNFDDTQELSMLPFEQLIEWIQQPETLDEPPRISVGRPHSPKVAVVGPHRARKRLSSAANDIIRTLVSTGISISPKH